MHKYETYKQINQHNIPTTVLSIAISGMIIRCTVIAIVASFYAFYCSVNPDSFAKSCSVAFVV